MNAREQVLGRIRAALGDVGPQPVAVPRDYVTALDGVDVVEMFAERVADYRARVHRVGAHEVADAVAGLVPAGARVVAAAGLPQAWRPTKMQLVTDDGTLTPGQLDEADAALTGCGLGIAQTGTLVLDGGPRSGRRALTLVPDHHVCVIEAGQVVGTVPEAIARLDPTRPVTFVSGPSATSDIELDRVEGVHGPRTLDVVIVAP